MRKIIVQELLRAGCVFILLMWGLWYLNNRGVLALSTSRKEFMLKRVRYLLILLWGVGVPVLIRLILAGEVIQAVLLAIGMPFVSLLLFGIRKKIGLEW